MTWGSHISSSIKLWAGIVSNMQVVSGPLGSKRTLIFWSKSSAESQNWYQVNLRHLSYRDQLLHLGLPTLQYRRLCYDMIQVYKILHKNIDRTEPNPKRLGITQNIRARGHSMKLMKPRCTGEHRRNSFLRIVDHWNSLFTGRSGNFKNT